MAITTPSPPEFEIRSTTVLFRFLHRHFEHLNSGRIHTHHRFGNQVVPSPVSRLAGCKDVQIVTHPRLRRSVLMLLKFARIRSTLLTADIRGTGRTHLLGLVALFRVEMAMRRLPTPLRCKHRSPTAWCQGGLRGGNAVVQSRQDLLCRTTGVSKLLICICCATAASALASPRRSRLLEFVIPREPGCPASSTPCPSDHRICPKP